MHDITFAEARKLRSQVEEEMYGRGEHVAKVAHAVPLNDRVLIRRLDEENRNQVQIADAWQPKSNLGEVLGIGRDAIGVLNKGDRVLFGHYSAQDIEVDGEQLVLISVHDIWLRL